MEWVTTIGALIAAVAAVVSAALAFVTVRHAREVEFRARLWPSASQAGRTAHRLVTEAKLTDDERKKRVEYLSKRAVPEIGVLSHRLGDRLNELVLRVERGDEKPRQLDALAAFDHEMDQIFATESQSDESDDEE